MDKAAAQWVGHPTEAGKGTVGVRVELECGGGELLEVKRD
jgi:hypothetical protein